MTSQEQQARYEANVDKIATDMAAAYQEDNEGREALYTAEAFIPAARIALKHMAEAFKDAHYAAWTTRGLYDGPAEGARIEGVKYLSEQRGLVPAKP